VDRNARVELFEQLRQEHEFGVGTSAGVAAKFGEHRRMVRKAIAGAMPPLHRYPARAKPKLGAVASFIDAVLDEDRRAPRKQRHTARRIYRRILTEFPDAAVAESTVRNHVRARKRAMGLILRETFVPQSNGLGQEAQVDWYEAWADIGGEGHEKGGVEGEGGYFRRNPLVPVPCVADLDALNTLLLRGCPADEARVLDGRAEPVGVAMAAERDRLLPRAPEGFDLADVTFPLVDKQGCATVKTNAYSVPIKAGTRVSARVQVHSLHVEIWHAGRRLARHERCHSPRQQVLDLEHYLDVLSQKPGAFAGSKPLAQWREAGR
jgi:hypothetical protein